MKLHIATLHSDEIPDSCIKFVAIKFKTGVTIFLKSALIDNPGFKASVVGTRDEPRGFATEAVVASKGVFQSDSETMADVQVAVGVRRWHDDRESIVMIKAVVVTVAVVVGGHSRRCRFKYTSSLPGCINIWFILIGFVTTRKFHFGLSSYSNTCDNYTTLGGLRRIGAVRFGQYCNWLILRSWPNFAFLTNHILKP